MPNMKYCMIRNTLPDLRDVLNKLENDDYISKEEYKAMEKIIDICRNIVTMADNDCLPKIEDYDNE